MTFADELQKLQHLREGGTLTDAEFQRAKDSLLAQQEAAKTWTSGASEGTPPRSVEDETRIWAIFLHLSQFIWFVPLGGILVPVLIWQVKKDALPCLDAHGRNVVNWSLSMLVYALICVPLIFLLVGIPLIIILGLLGLIFPIIGAVQASHGQVWKYPMAIPFLKPV